MAFKSGFFDSLNGDRKYNSAQMSQIFDGIINDGVFQNIGGAFFVNANEGMNVNVSAGRAWFNSTWSYNDSEYGINIDESNIVYPRIDTICLKIDSTLAVRSNSIVVLKGTPSSTPIAPTYVDTDEIHYHPLADVYVGAGVTEIAQANITNRVGTSVTPFVTGILETIDTDELLVQWEAQFSIWFEHIRGQLDEDAAGHLQNEIDDINADIADKADKDLSNVTGTLAVANGGTGQASLQATRNAMGLGNTTGALPVANGGTEQTTLALARNAMGLGNTTGALPIANGGTGQTTAALARNALGLGNTTGALPVANGGTGSGDRDIARVNLGCGNIAIYNIYTQVDALVTAMTNWQTVTYSVSSHGNKSCFAAFVCPAGRWEGTYDFQCYVTRENGGADVIVHYRSSEDYKAMGFTLVMFCVN